MRSDRLLSILLLLQTNRRMKARELATRFEVSERTILRDLESLSAAGVPVVAIQGNGGGWELLEAYRTNLTGLNPTEIQALFLSQPERLLADLGLRQAADSATIKLLAALPSVNRQDAEHVRQRIHVDGAGWRELEERVPALPVLQSAVWQDRKVLLTYQRGEDGTIFERLVDPLGLVVKGRIWYLVALVLGEHEEGALRTYRVSRIQDAKLMEQPSKRPEGFDLAAHWEQSVVEFRTNIPRYPACVRIAPDLLKSIRHGWRYARIEQVGVPGPDGWLQVDVTYEGEEEIFQYVMSCGVNVEVLTPQWLRRKVAETAQSLLAIYQ